MGCVYGIRSEHVGKCGENLFPTACLGLGLYFSLGDGWGGVAGPEGFPKRSKENPNNLQTQPETIRMDIVATRHIVTPHVIIIL